jgi:hypothetical protein
LLPGLLLSLLLLGLLLLGLRFLGGHVDIYDAVTQDHSSFRLPLATALKAAVGSRTI